MLWHMYVSNAVRFRIKKVPGKRVLVLCAVIEGTAKILRGYLCADFAQSIFSIYAQPEPKTTAGKCFFDRETADGNTSKFERAIGRNLNNSTKANLEYWHPNSVEAGQWPIGRFLTQQELFLPFLRHDHAHAFPRPLSTAVLPSGFFAWNFLVASSDYGVSGRFAGGCVETDAAFSVIAMRC